MPRLCGEPRLGDEVQIAAEALLRRIGRANALRDRFGKANQRRMECLAAGPIFRLRRRVLARPRARAALRRGPSETQR
jgi:hypothetical protein